MLIESAGHRILIDPGLHDITPEAITALKSQGDLVATVVTHAHADHMGGLPMVAEAFPNMRILATPPTLAFLRVLLAGSLTIEQESAHAIKAQSERPVGVTRAQSIPFNEPLLLSGQGDQNIGWKLTFFAAGHVLGATMAYLETPDGTVMVTGDVSSLPQHTVRRASRPTLPVDVLILESTYGDRTFRPRDVEEGGLLALVHVAQDRGGHVLIGTQPLGTAQEILMVLLTARERERLVGNIWVDGQVRNVNRVYATHAPDNYPRLARFVAEHGNPFLPGNPFVRVVTNASDRTAILTGNPSVIVTTSPSLASGPSRYFAEALAQESKHMVLLPEQQKNVQFMSPIAAHGGPRCAVDRYSISLHSDGVALASLAARLRPGLTLLLHGSSTARRKLSVRLSELGLSNHSPAPGENVIHKPG